MGHKIICIDNLLTGSTHNINDLLNHSNFEFINHDIIDPFMKKILMKYII